MYVHVCMYFKKLRSIRNLNDALPANFVARAN